VVVTDRLDVSVVIVSWNTREWLARTLGAVAASADGLGLEVIVVDNASSDGTPAMVAERYPDVRLIEHAENLGFGAACNAGARTARGRAVLFLNSDCEPAPESLATMLRVLDREPTVGAVFCRLVNADGTLQPSIHESSPGPWSLAGDVLLFSALRYGVYRRRGLARWLLGRARARHARAHDVAWGGAACVLVRRQAFAAIGGFDERFFLYCEDLDLCRRLRDAGWVLRYVPEASAVHHWGRSTVKRPAAVTAAYRSRLLYFDKHFPGWGGPTARALLTAELAVRRVLFSAVALVPSPSRERFRGRARATAACAAALGTVDRPDAARMPGLRTLLALVVLLAAFGYAHDVVKLGLTSDFIDFAHYTTYARIVAEGGDPFDPAVVAALDARLPIARSPGGPDYPPLFYLLMRPWTLVSPKVGALAWLLMGQLLLLGSLALVLARASASPPARLAAVAVVVLSYQPLREEIAVGQANLVLLALVTLGWWAARGKRVWLAAAALGLTVHVKPQYGLLVPLLWLKGDGALARRAVGIGALGLVASVATLGVPYHVAWLREMVTSTRTLFTWNIAGAAIVGRVVQGLGGAPIVAQACAVVIDGALLSLVVAALRSGPAGQDVEDWSWALAIAAVPLTTPMMEEHHLVVLILPLALSILRPGVGRRDAGLLVASTVLLASRYSFVRFGSVQSGLAALALGGKLVGVILLAGALALRLRDAGCRAVAARS
jgi:N-acetylglucosaminyl-diphospho-decaprenol L-rhamnosyltransferase